MRTLTLPTPHLTLLQTSIALHPALLKMRRQRKDYRHRRLGAGHGADNTDTTGAAHEAAAEVAGTIADVANTETPAAAEETNATDQEID
eukprot:1720736-Pleurochrysis_carterae.AAC.1